MQPYSGMLAQRRVKQSTSRKGDRFEISLIGSFIGIFKAEYFHFATLDCLEELEAGFHNYIDCYSYYRIKLELRGDGRVNTG